MTVNLPPTASVAHPSEGQKLHAPAAARNAEILCKLLRDHAPAKGQALEIASGTGQHVTAFARAFPDLSWQPTEIAADRLASINAYRAETGLKNIASAVVLDATQPKWDGATGNKDLIVLINLLHLITTPAAQRCIEGALSALKNGGRFILYGPFMRSGQLTSPGDVTFHAQISEADARLGYKDDREIENWLKQAGARKITCIEMPSNNLAFVATR